MQENSKNKNRLPPETTTKRGSLENGLDAIEQYLGLPSGQAAFINEFYSSRENFPDLAEPTDWVLGDTSAGLAPVVMAGQNAALLTLSCPRNLVEYLSSNDLIPQNANVISVCNPGDVTTRLFPDGSIISKLQQNINDTASIFQGKTFVPSFGSPEAKAFAETVGGQILNTTKQSIDFNSKSYMRRISDVEGFNMPVGLIITPDETLESGIIRFKQMATQKDLPLSPAWLKFPSVAGGGTIPLPNGPSIDAIQSNFLKFIQSANGGYTEPPISKPPSSYEDIPKSMLRDIILEFDVVARGEVKILGNYCFQAVIGERGVTYVGTTGQVTEDGNYMGGYTLSQNEKDLIENVLPDIFTVFESFQKRGYRGVMGVDALITTSTQGEIKPYILEANCRMNGSTPLLGLVQKLETIKGQNMYGESITIPVPVNDGTPDIVMGGILKYFNDAGLLYQKDKNTGIIPFMPDVYRGRPDSKISSTRCAIIGTSYGDVQTVKNTLASLTREI
jgi:hypothetical protein